MKVNVQKLEEVFAWFAPYRRARLTYVSLACLALALAFGGHEVRAADLDPQAAPRGVAGPRGPWRPRAARPAITYITINKVEATRFTAGANAPATGKSGESNWKFVGHICRKRRHRVRLLTLPWS